MICPRTKIGCIAAVEPECMQATPTGASASSSRSRTHIPILTKTYPTSGTLRPYKRTGMSTPARTRALALRDCPARVRVGEGCAPGATSLTFFSLAVLPKLVFLPSLLVLLCLLRFIMSSSLATSATPFPATLSVNGFSHPVCARYLRGGCVLVSHSPPYPFYQLSALLPSPPTISLVFAQYLQHVLRSCPVGMVGAHSLATALAFRCHPHLVVPYFSPSTSLFPVSSPLSSVVLASSSH
ncbi:hypothetical protein PLICRDRAFT_434830 [Plicaturopsis crispa FD-325 SS-3]|uniref:Uncharacterized protein n=1 Tax=Plicaturopsis crispa FD-325 SS-3 TaxID=944288 RepID=A0A0C9T3S6_PLICR|nr:hypothetical protein PLICRDRAFT_434830 [Plicaturopsis crispa FD-325 SS-3]